MKILNSHKLIFENAKYDFKELSDSIVTAHAELVLAHCSQNAPELELKIASILKKDGADTE